MISIFPKKANNGLILYEKLFGVKSYLEGISIFSCTIYVHIKSYQIKLKSKVIMYKFVAYDKTSKIYRCFEPMKRKLNSLEMFNLTKLLFEVTYMYN